MMNFIFLPGLFDIIMSGMCFLSFEFLNYKIKTMEKNLRIRSWITLDGDKFFGPGRVELLGWIQSEGSLAKAAQKMGMSYKKAWDMVNDLNSRGSQPYVLLKKGGEKGGGAAITPHAKGLILRFEALSEKIEKIILEENEILDMI